MNDQLEAFRQGDVRGTYPEEINEQFVVDFAHAFVGHFGLNGKIATGRDMRNSSELLQNALNETLASIGIEVVNIGLCPTELGYFASGMPEINAAIVVTASHNPANYNGLKNRLSGISHRTVWKSPQLEKLTSFALLIALPKITPAFSSPPSKGISLHRCMPPPN